MINSAMWIVGIVFWSLLASMAHAQNINEAFQRISMPVVATIIEKDGTQEKELRSRATGFFYQAL